MITEISITWQCTDPDRSRNGALHNCSHRPSAFCSRVFQRSHLQKLRDFLYFQEIKESNNVLPICTSFLYLFFILLSHKTKTNFDLDGFYSQLRNWQFTVVKAQSHCKNDSCRHEQIGSDCTCLSSAINANIDTNLHPNTCPTATNIPKSISQEC